MKKLELFAAVVTILQEDSTTKKEIGAGFFSCQRCEWSSSDRQTFGSSPLPFSYVYQKNEAKS